MALGCEDTFSIPHRRGCGSMRQPIPCPIEAATASVQGATAWECLRAIVPPYLEYDPPSAAVAKTWLGLRDTAHGERIDLTQFTFKSERHTGSFGRYVSSGTSWKDGACCSSRIELAVCFTSHECNSVATAYFGSERYTSPARLETLSPPLSNLAKRMPDAYTAHDIRKYIDFPTAFSV